MTMYGYVSGFYKDKIIKDPGFEHRAGVLLSSGIPYKNCFADGFSRGNKERYKLHMFLANIAKEGDILFVPDLTDLYSNVRELCCIMHDIENTGIIIKSSDMDLSDDSDASNWIISSQLAQLDYAHYLHQKCLSKAIKKAKYQTTVNVGGHNKRVITPKYVNTDLKLSEITGLKMYFFTGLNAALHVVPCNLSYDMICQKF